MPKRTFYLPTWECESCGYKQDFDPSNPELMNIHFPGYPVGNCPACFSGKNKTRQKGGSMMIKVVDSEKKTKVVVKGEEEIDADSELKDKEKVALKKKIQDQVAYLETIEEK